MRYSYPLAAASAPADDASLRSQAGQIALQCLRVVMLLQQGVLRPADPGVPTQLAAVVAAGILGAVVGDQLHGSVSDALVVRIILVLLLMGCVSMVVDLKGGSLAANVLVACMGTLTIGALLLLIGRHLWLRCREKPEGGRGSRAGGSVRRVPAGARCCDRVLFGSELRGAYRRRGERYLGAL